MNAVDADHLLSWLVDAPLYAVLVDVRNYTHKPEHRFFSDISGASGFHEQLVGKRVADGVLYASDVRFLAVKFPAAGVAIYRKAGSPRTSPVLVYADTLVGLPSDGKGGDVIMPFSAGVIRIRV